ncbi:MAG: outer membrane protein transport protein [Bacteroidota bacterium]|nr:outer membrane protein transport protein [Bacteroidota bacterium]
MKVRYIAILTLLLISVGVLFPNGLSLNSIGPKSLGMGGAFVGLANDYSAVYWNPAGLTQMQKNFVGVFATDIIPMGTYKNTLANIDAKTKTNHYISPNLMGYYHCELVENLIWGLGVYLPACLGTEWDGNDLKNLTGTKDFEWMSKIGVVNISPALSYKFSDQFSVGAAFNIFYGMFDMKRPADMGPLGVHQYTESSTGFGYGVTVGALAKVHEMISVGASFRTKTDVKMSGSAENPGMSSIPGLAPPEKSDFDRDVSWPMWIAGGIAVRPMDGLAVTADAQFSQWSKSEDEFTTEFKDAKWMTALTPKGENKFILKWKDAMQIRFGVGYEVNEDLNLRAGYYIDPAPAPDSTYSILFPSISYNTFTLGAGYKYSDFIFDLGLEYLIGKDREITAAINPTASGTHGMNIFAISFGAGYEF